MKVFRHSILLLFALLCGLQGQAQQQRFFNLTVDDIAIDTMLPRFSYAIPLGKHYADSIYTLEIRYPEFLEMGRRDSLRYLALAPSADPGRLPEIEQHIVVDRKKGRLDFSLCPVVRREGRLQFLVSFMIAVTSQPKPSLKAPSHAGTQRDLTSSEDAAIYAKHSVLREGRWVKIRVPESGIYQLTSQLARQAGFSDLSRVRIFGYGGNLQNEELLKGDLAATDDLPEVASTMVGDRRLFYAKGPVSWENKEATRRTRNPYSDYGYYFLTETDGKTPLMVDSAQFIADCYPLADDYHALREVDNFSWYQGGRNLFENDPIEQGKSRTYVFSHPAGENRMANLTIAVTAGAAASVQYRLNGKDLGNASLRLSSYNAAVEAENTYKIEHTTSDTITVTTLSGGPVRMDYISYAYERPKPQPRLATDPFPVPEYVYAITNQDHHADPQADLVIIIPTSQKLRPQAERLAQMHRDRDSMRVNIVPADELYNEFSSGTPDANAYRRYLKMLYDRAGDDEAQMPKHLLLFGDAVWDCRMLTPECRSLNADDYLLAHESENSFSETDCYVNDGWMTLLDEGEGGASIRNDKEDVAVGRIPVTTTAEAKAVVDKIIAYANNAHAGDWANTIMFMGDDGNNNLHMRDVDATAEYIGQLYPGYQIKKVMWDAYTRVSTSTGNRYPEVSRLLKQQQQAGALVMDYAGHGVEYQISHESVLTISDFRTFTNQNLPLWITASCDVMPFDTRKETIGETALLNAQGGSVAFWGTTRTVYAYYNKFINNAFLRHVLSFANGKPTTMGEAQRLAKNDVISTGQDRTLNKLQYSLLGDPALALNLPTFDVVIDSINGLPVGGKQDIILKAGSVARVKGRVMRQEETLAGFNGQMTATVRDTREMVTCKKQEETSNSAFQYYDRQKVLFNGSDSVRNGEFQFTFAVPFDINYASGSGLINVYAVSDDHTQLAHGAEDRFFIYGSETVRNDSIGPSIYCYLNTPSFVDGGSVNTTPYFVANVTDKDGINATGSGMGHDLQLCIDGDPNLTFNLNENFTFDFGTYTSGSTWYSLPELSEGAHQLRFRAWDMLNNASTAVLNFQVVKGLKPSIESISCTNNPATTETTFIVNHNFTGAEVDVEISVFDMSGRELWRHTESGTSTSSAYTVRWNLCADGGAKLQTGVYLYRASIGSDGGERVSKAKKLIIINNK